MKNGAEFYRRWLAILIDTVPDGAMSRISSGYGSGGYRGVESQTDNNCVAECVSFAVSAGTSFYYENSDPHYYRS